MDRDSVERLRHDRRLARRREWLSEEDRASFLDSLPDVSEKMTRGIDEPDDEAAAAAAGSADPAASAPQGFGQTGGSETGSGPLGGGSDSSGGVSFS